MNSYPPELLVQLAPVMFAAGLDQPPPTPADTRPDPYNTLIARLRDVLSKQRKATIWQPEREKTFQVVFVDKEVRFPPRKMPPPEDHPYATTHSPLSPLTPSSPLYPDGLVAPIWIRKHTTLVPAVFVLFMRLYEHPQQQQPRSPLDVYQQDPEREQEERRRDSELSAEIAQRKKATNERNMKLTVVLIASRRLLDDPSLDARLTYVRRTSGLDSRAALFVLSPVSPAELEDFSRSLQEALYEPAVEYYTAHSKRVRRKRNRHSQAAATYAQLSPALATGAARPLRPEGWNVRYEFKMACFAEFRGEYDVALKHYQDAYSTLLMMFGSTTSLPPRTKRWAEAKVLIDCMNVKICKLYLYNAESSLALLQHNAHIRKFSDLSRGWGIGEETFEFWSWIARQYRVLAELLEQGTRTTLSIPTHRPTASGHHPSVSLASLPPASRALVEPDAVRALGTNPTVALQHPGFYYYMAARCTERRRARFMAAEEAGDQRLMASPGFANEKKVDHLTIILELFTRAYELFKKHMSPAEAQGRLTLWIAYRIGQTYFRSGKFDMAAKFFERIARTYRREKWETMLRPLLSTWYKCAQQMGDVDLSVQLLVEMLGHGYVEDDDPGSAAEDLLAVLQSTVPSNSEGTLEVDLSESEPIFDSTVLFWKPDVLIGEAATFQIRLRLPDHVSLVALPLASLSIYFNSEDSTPFVVNHSPESEPPAPSSTRVLELGDVTAENATTTFSADLRWNAGSSLVLVGSMVATEQISTLKVSKMLLAFKEGSWSITVAQDPWSRRLGSTHGARWLSSTNPPRFITMESNNFMAIVKNRAHQIELTIDHPEPAYTGEEYPITVSLINHDSRAFHTTLNVLLQPSEEEDAINSIRIDEEVSTGLIKGIPLGLLDHEATAQKTIFLRLAGAPGKRVLDISVQSRESKETTGEASSHSSPTPLKESDIGELLHTLTVPAISPLKAEHTITYRRSLKPAPGFADIRSFDADHWDDSTGGEAYVRSIFACAGPWKLQVENVSLIREDGDFAKVLSCSADADLEDMIGEWLPGDEFADLCRISIAPDDGQDLTAQPIVGPGAYEIQWRRIMTDGTLGSSATTRLPLPALNPPVDGLLALLSVPPVGTLHAPLPLTLTLRNRHAARASNVTVQVDTDPTTDGFVLAGVRSGRAPILLPGGDEHVFRWNLIPLECGVLRLPRFRVVDRRKPFASSSQAAVGTEGDGTGEVVKVIDARWDARAGEGKIRPEGDAQNEEETDSDDDVPLGGRLETTTILVLPSQ